LPKSSDCLWSAFPATSFRAGQPRGDLAGQLTKAPVSHPLRKPKPVWLLPQLQAEVAYSNVTADGMLRHGILKGLRYDLK
jgi:ATP-dependent DNA ligase